MKRLLLLLSFIAFINPSFAQTFENSDLPVSVLYIPSAHSSSPEAIGEYVAAQLKSEKGKVAAIYLWVASNIRYDTDSINIINLGINTDAKITEAFRRRKGVCENFAAIYNAICKHAGIQSFVIDGYTKQSGGVDKVGHNWCAVNIDNRWYLTDPTWASATGIKSKYFLVSPANFIETHMPFDPLWQCLNYPISHEQFYSGNFSPAKKSNYFSYTDSIKAYFKMDSLNQLYASAARIKQQRFANDMVKDRYNFLKMHIEMINQDKDVDLNNAAIRELNESTEIYNAFVQYRNNLFKPAKPDADLQLMLDGIDKKILSAFKKADEIDRSPATFTFSTEAFRSRLNKLLERVSEQKDFLRRYLGASVTERNNLFFK